ncbi:NAD(P)H-hydrate dehydratase [Roseovarius sp. MS2]|uniref:NAD(P)H-hydrate dehydratase n=1 Tax=Roseovarius sp. MS2 TaxID=3390728 RepID=UPI003EDB8562
MLEILTATEMRAREQVAIESGGVTGLDLMERAGRAVVDAVFAEWPELAQTPQTAAVLCGPGNNGGDGFVIARLLKAWGWEVGVYLYGDPERLPPDARINHDRWCAMGSVHDLAQASVEGLKVALMVDALFGTGLRRPLEGVAQQGLNQVAAHVVAVDLPSGLCSDSGRVLGTVSNAVRAALTVTFHAPKLGHVLADGPAVCGRVMVADIGLAAQAEGAVRLVAPPDAQSLTKAETAHKFGHGHALILTGGAGTTGAARLAARAALRIGAGVVTLGVPPSAQMEVAAQITALMLRRIEDGQTLHAALTDKRITALCSGPGMGTARARDLVPVVLRHESAPRVVLDADALTAFADAPETLFGLLHEGCVLTPHGGEFARLFPDIAARLAAPATQGPAYSKVEATREAAKRAGCVVLLKGADTVIAAPDGACAIHAAAYGRAAPWLATAGAGDVLAGFIAGLLARGFPPMQAAETAAWLHGECARCFGPGLIAEDLPEVLPKVLRALPDQAARASSRMSALLANSNPST